MNTQGHPEAGASGAPDEVVHRVLGRADPAGSARPRMNNFGLPIFALGGITHMTMTTLTKDQVGKRPTEQQEALATAEVGRLRSRHHLLERARRGMSAWAGLWMGLAGGLAILSTTVPRVLPFAIIAVASLTTYHATRIYRRLDAMMELFDQDSGGVSKREVSDDDHAA